jgi:predicted RNase H-like HicB family nuclease
MDRTIQVKVRQQDDGRYVAQSLQPKILVVADSREEALEQLQDELTFALESSYPGTFAGDFQTKELMITLAITEEVA